MYSLVLVDGGDFVPAGQDGAQALEDVDVLLPVGPAELEAQGILAVIDGDAAGDDLGAVGDDPVGAALLAAERVGQGVDEQVLEDVLLPFVGRGDGVGLEMDQEADELGVGPQVEGVQGGHQAEGGGPRGQAEGLVADGADGEAGVREAGQVVGPAEADVLDREFDGIGIVQEALVDEVLADLGAGLEAGGQREGEDGEEECFPTSGFHCDKLS